MPAGRYARPEQRRAFHARLEERLEAAPALASAALASARPFVDSVSMGLLLEGEPPADPPRTVQMVVVGDRYFETLGLRLRRGRAFGPDDGLPGRDHVIVNERFASLHFPGVDPIGRRIRLSETSRNAIPGQWLTVVGVSPSVRQRPMGPAAAIAYLPLRARPGPFTAVILRPAGDPAQAASALRAEIRHLDPDVAAYNIESLERLSEKSRWTHRMLSAFLALFAPIGTVLSAAGLYAIAAYGVTGRRSEIGIRLALGARRSQVAWLFMRRTLLHAAIGLTTGMAGALAAGQVLRGLLVGTSPTDPLTFAGTALLLLATAAAACLIPARRAMRLDPLAVLRRE
jgi:predicted permease